MPAPPCDREVEDPLLCAPQSLMLRGRQIVLRPIRPGDLEQHRRFLARVAARDLYTRFFAPVRSFSEAQLQRFTAIDYAREMAFVATEITECGSEETLGAGRACADRGFAGCRRASCATTRR